jgi:putative sigma-54 modulation protein
MKIELAGNFPLSASGREFITQQAERKLGRFQGRIREADITIDDINGPKGGNDIRCLIRARLNRLPDVVIEETAGTVGAALHALDRAVHAVTRVIDKRRSQRRRSDAGQTLAPRVA